MDKLLAMNVAALLANAAIAHGDDALPIDPTITDPNVRAKNLQVWELHRIFYAATIKALADDQSWPPPPGGLGKVVGALGGLLESGKLGSLLPVLQSVLGGLKPTIPAPGSELIPNPGSSLGSPTTPG